MTSNQSLWKLAEWVGLLATPVLLVGLFQWPEPTLKILWNVVIPLVPASLLLTPLLWRNTCPLSTLNLYGNKLPDRPWPPSWFVTAAPALGIALFAATLGLGPVAGQAARITFTLFVFGWWLRAQSTTTHRFAGAT